MKDKKVLISKRYIKALQTKVRHLKGELSSQRRIVEFVKKFNPRLFYREPKYLISIVSELKEELTGKSCKK